MIVLSNRVINKGELRTIIIRNSDLVKEVNEIRRDSEGSDIIKDRLSNLWECISKYLLSIDSQKFDCYKEISLDYRWATSLEDITVRRKMMAICRVFPVEQCHRAWDCIRQPCLSVAEPTFVDNKNPRVVCLEIVGSNSELVVAA